ncbi:MULTISPECIES: RICIN domain-containing protein [Myxococcus]|uniref:RICIN domain-containing protein n=1 Tax=Myxococcus llanfairpwllgwyngyllgogerychwyrndrobwllllantysiliogogogochensis TaxID=2590453 RepID=A0A540X8J6_9BACT|nr:MULTISPECIES: RICIN domain-containing protein [Myxococcus]NTX03503.1 RICIN domain-containing protein [Myxococcus sp. CA040A]TQF17499.1 RICIN domain-containing protein [Myxococcus llanfairpwllgwyngyllgogerychwyrndrobwllllantysiliogogogochensis]
MPSPKWLLLAALAFACVASAASPVPTYQTQTLEGWTVRIDDRLMAGANRPLTEKALVLLAAQLKEVIRIVPAGPVAQLRKVTLWLSPPYPNEPEAARYHAGDVLLRRSGRSLTMLKSIEFTNVLIFEKETRRMPIFVLHELSHAYHDHVLGEHAGIEAAYARARENKSYDCVERWRGPEVPITFERAYAMTDDWEYFAETSEALFGRNDYYPFTREDLARHDPGMLALLQQVWQLPTTTAPTPPTTSTPPPVSAPVDARCYYRLTTLWQGDGMSLDIIGDGKANNTPILATTGRYTGQLWKLTPEANGFYRLTTQWRGTSLSLANTAGNRPLLVKSAAVPEQRWKLTPEPNGIYRLTTQAQGDVLSLDIVNDSRANNIPILAKTSCNDSGQLWKLTPERPVEDEP